MQPQAGGHNRPAQWFLVLALSRERTREAHFVAAEMCVRRGQTLPSPALVQRANAPVVPLVIFPIMMRRYPVMAALALVAAAALPGCRDPAGNDNGGARGERVLWRVASGASSNAIAHEPAANAARSMVYFLTTDYRLKKIRASDGAVIWNVDAGPVFSTSPRWNVALSGGNVIIEKIDLFAFDTTTGARRWTYEAPGGEDIGYTAIVSDDTTVFAASLGGHAYAIDARTGAARWIADLNKGYLQTLAFFPVLSNGAVYVCSYGVGSGPHYGTLWALSAADGSVRWSHDFEPEFPQQYSICLGDAATWNDLVIQPQTDGRVYAFESATGAIRWIAPAVHQIPSPTTPDVGSWTDDRFAASFGDNLIVTSKAKRGMIVSIDPATGVERWRNEEIADAILSHPVLDEHSVYVGFGSIYAAFDLASGRLRWRLPGTDAAPPTQLQGRPVIATDRIFVAGRDGSYAIEK